VSKRLKMLAVSLLLSCIMVVTLAGAAFAAQERNYVDSGNWGENTSEVDCPIRAQDGSCQD